MVPDALCRHLPGLQIKSVQNQSGLKTFQLRSKASFCLKNILSARSEPVIIIRFYLNYFIYLLTKHDKMDILYETTELICIHKNNDRSWDILECPCTCALHTYTTVAQSGATGQRYKSTAQSIARSLTHTRQPHTKCAY